MHGCLFCLSLSAPNFRDTIYILKIVKIILYRIAHFMIKTTTRIIFLLTLWIFLGSWGWQGHQIINGKCPASFPVIMVGFNLWTDSLITNATNADNRRNSDPSESPKHFIDIDNYTEFISTGRIASTYDSIVNIYGATYVINNGTLPWATRNTYDSLVVAFRQFKWHKAMLLASDLGHYVADGHMPLHLSSNYDGQKTGQRGIHSHYESDMVSAYNTSLSNYSGFIGAPVNSVSNVNKYVFDYIYRNQHYVDSVLIADTYAKGLDATYGPTYYAALWAKTQFTKTLFHNASHALAELIYSAWTEAGSPSFGARSITNIINLTAVQTVSVYPNPTSGILNLVGDNILKAELSSVDGKLIGLFYKNQCDLSNYSNGMYILSMYGKEGLLRREKILIAR